MKTSKRLLLLASMFFICTGLHAQVSIGNEVPVNGALLDLNTPSGNKGGLLLSNVQLTDLATIPADFPGVDAAADLFDMKIQFRGALVYHTGENNIPAGVYVWSGCQWIPAGDEEVCPCIIVDSQGNSYTANQFGEAGCWMTQNLRSTQYSDKVNLTKESEYCYENDFQNEPMEYGVLYPWAVASRRSSAGADTDGVGDTPQQTPHQGICPEGWRLPSDYEWNQLEKVIAESDANVYSTQGSVTYGNLLTTGYRGNHGSKMKSNSSQNPAGDGTSLSNTDGGFNALLIGYGCGNSEFNNNAHFWSSSSVDTGKGWSRELSRNNSGVNRSDSQNKTTFYSVRCKKN